ncbi:hypothetical protein [Candidatus Tisiphia endosymbiont of Oplodontha viridula]|uniref:hypothetical protein n=1 Tax=Candidatus Tisiphia endosymbiont of Oplodontha viridula TaxID=3077925 RepID=UPI0035C8F8C7
MSSSDETIQMTEFMDCHTHVHSLAMTFLEWHKKTKPSIYGQSPLMGLDGVHNCRKLEERVLNRVTSLREDRRSTKQSIK